MRSEQCRKVLLRSLLFSLPTLAINLIIQSRREFRREQMAEQNLSRKED